MPGLSRKLLIFAAVDGLVLQPISRRDQKPSQAIRIEYGTNKLLPQGTGAQVVDENKRTGLEAHGVIGFINTTGASYLITITQRQEVARVWGKPVYVIQDVAIIPLSARYGADEAIRKAREASLDRDIVLEADIPTLADIHAWQNESDADSSQSADANPVESESEELPVNPVQRNRGNTRQSSNIAQNVIHKKGLYGRFAEQWFSKGGWNNERRTELTASCSEDTDRPVSPVVAPATLAPGLSSSRNMACFPANSTKQSVLEASSNQENQSEQGKIVKNNVANITPKLLSTTKLLFESKTFFFSYDIDITRSLAAQPAPISDIPLYKLVETQYFWNRHLSSAFMNDGFDELLLPIMQGFVGQKKFSVVSKLSEITKADSAVSAARTKQPDGDSQISQQASDSNDSSSPKEFMLTLISRRSIHRAGLRYLRRGVDEDGHSANMVETEQILSSSSWNLSEPIFSFLQVRGSIPLFFSQTPYSFKPVPVLHGSPESNQKAFKKHFHALVTRYGTVHAVSLLDAHGVEVKLGDAYQENAKTLNAKDGINGNEIAFEWFDFHAVCKGMKFENVRHLVEHQRSYLSTSGWMEMKNNIKIRNQIGVVRTNCMDCLDRTNVVQSAFARFVLEEQLLQQGSVVNLDKDLSTTWFNILWADNGDAISRAYAGTSALKGDYTRTRKRNIGGALNDLSLTLSRYYNNLFNDFFGQACIDYLLGNVNDSVFMEFETNMMSADPAMDLDNLRQHAIDTCVKVIVEDHEDLVCGWAVSCPQEPNTIKTFPFEESLLLLTQHAMYSCRFDWNTEKAQSFERVPLNQITSLKWGTYITSTLGPQHTDEKLNVGLVVGYRPTGKVVVRVNTRSLQNEKITTQTEAKVTDTRILAFKAIPNRSSIIGSKLNESKKQTEIDLVRHICKEIHDVAISFSQKNGECSQEFQIEEKAIISLEEARRNTGYLEHIGYSLKRLVWG